MLHDPKRDIPQLLTVDRVAMWLETQPPEKEYDYLDNCNCLLAQYLTDYGYENVYVTNESVIMDGKYYDFPDLQFNRIMWPGVSVGTFGDALKRAKAIIARKQKELSATV